MPSTFAPFGLSIYDYEGGKPNFTMRDMPLAASGSGDGVAKSFGQGDAMGLVSANGYSGLVAVDGNGNADVVAGYVMGIFTQVSYTTAQGQVVPGGSTSPGYYWPANTATLNTVAPLVKLNHLPNTIYQIQCNASLPSQGAYGVNYTLVENGGVYNSSNGNSGVPFTTDAIVAANPASGQSQQFLRITAGSAGAASTNGTCKIIGLAPTSSKLPSNSWTDAYPVVLVKINLHFLSAPTLSTL